MSAAIAFFAAAMPLVFNNAVDGVLTVKGLAGTNECTFVSQRVPFAPGELGLFSVEMRAPKGATGSCTIGSESVNADVHCTASDWMRKELVFATAANANSQQFHLGQWHMDGEVEFRNPTVTRVRPKFRQTPAGPLGHDEVVEGNVYRFAAPTDLASRNFSRPLVSFRNLSENHNRWVLMAGAEMTFRFALPGRHWQSAETAAAIIYASNTNAVEVVASKDGREWRSLGELRKDGRNVAARLPADLFPADEIFIRFREKDGPAGIQIPMFRFEGRFDGEQVFAAGATDYADAETGKVVASAKPASLYDEGYGESLGSATAGSLWSAPSFRKVWRWAAAPSPKASAKAIAFNAAGNEAESAQLVFKAKDAVEDVRVETDGPIGAIAAENVEVFKVGYLRCEYRSDGEGMFGEWPDLLLPQSGNCSLLPGANQPFWVRVSVPAGTPAGIHRGQLVVRVKVAGNKAYQSRIVPLEVNVAGFDLPKRSSLSSAFGLGFWHVAPYHRFLNETPESIRREVYRKYIKSFATHRISPQEAYPAAIKVTWKGDPKNPAAVEPVVDFTSFDAMMEVIDEFNFNAVCLNGFIARNILGGGAGGSKYKAEILGYAQGTSEHTLLAEKFVAEVAKHIRAKGWTDLCYVYLYDEPEVETYPHVRLLSSYWEHQFPELRRLITEQPAEGLAGGPNLWCPEVHLLRAPGYRPLKAKGDGFWWYICAEPTCPFVGPFVDHPGIDLRVWIWQTWANDIRGILFWDTTYWNTSSLYGSPYNRRKRQDPYVDPAGWATVNKNFGNGDGRFLYPPEESRNPDGGPIMDGPVETIRWEVLRDGMEDYEYFAMLRKLDPVNPLLKVPSEVTSALEEYSRDGAALLKHRAAVAAEIMRLSKKGE